MKLRIAGLVLGLGMGIAVSAAEATPVNYLGVLTPGVTVSGVNMQVPGDLDNPEGADYWAFVANAGSPLNIVGDRLSGHYDMAFWIFRGIFADTTAFGTFLDPSDPGFVGLFDDEDLPNIPGLFGDPHATFNATGSGAYTLIVTNGFGSLDPPPNPYSLRATGINAVPEPGTILLMGAGLVVLVRRRIARSLF